MNKGFSFKKLNKSFLVTTLFLVGIAFFIPNYVMGAKKIELTVKPTNEDISLSWETKTKIDEFIITRTTEEETKLFFVKGDINSYLDTQVEQRTEYTYKVTAKRKGKIIEVSNLVENVILTKANNPHGMYSDATSLCNTCHLNREELKGLPESKAQAQLCFSCHADKEKHFKDVKASGSSHPVMAEGTDLKCTSCHNPHKAADDNNPSILELSFKLKNDSVVKLDAVSDDFCFACHGEGGQSNKMVNKEYYQEGSHSRPIGMKETQINSKISCNNCHTSHVSEFRSLLKFQFDPFSEKTNLNNNQLCFSCHGQDSKTNILEFYNGNKDGVNKGHYIKDKELAKALDVSVGWKLSCADCHDIHGSQNDKSISNKFGNFSSISDPIEKERAICTSCHAYSNEDNQKSIFRGIFYAALPGTVEQHNESPAGDLKSCSSCHGNNNPILGAHSPISGLKPPKNTEEPALEEKKTEPVKDEKPKTDNSPTVPVESDPTGEGSNVSDSDKESGSTESTEQENQSNENDSINSVPKETY